MLVFEIYIYQQIKPIPNLVANVADWDWIQPYFEAQPAKSRLRYYIQSLTSIFKDQPA